MTMTFSLQENLEIGGGENYFGGGSSSNFRSQPDEFHLFADKLKIPQFDNQIQRPRLNEILKKSVEKFGTTLINGRAGTGKTALAANFAQNYRKTAWLKIDSADANWNVFSRYFSAGVESLLNGKKNNAVKSTSFASNSGQVSHFVETKIAEIGIARQPKPMLIVFDDVHHIFDAQWFEEFFLTLIYSLTPDIQILMLSRGTPALPLWRLRSKQVLGVIDEKLLSFDLKETSLLFEKFGQSLETANKAYIKSFGRASLLRSIVETG